MPDFSLRETTLDEWMDDLEMEGVQLSQTLDQLAQVNRWLGGNQVMVSGVKALLKKTESDPGEVIKIADLGCGGGDGIRALARWAQKKHYNFQITGIDANESCIQYARDKSADYEGISYQCLNCFSKDWLAQRFDIVHCGLFLHHFDQEVLSNYVPQLCQMARLGLVINDLHRHPLAYRLFQLATFVFRASKMVRHDGLVSIRRAFKVHELRQLIPLTEDLEVSLSWKWAFRYQMLLYKQQNSIRNSQTPNNA